MRIASATMSTAHHRGEQKPVCCRFSNPGLLPVFGLKVLNCIAAMCCALLDLSLCTRRTGAVLDKTLNKTTDVTIGSFTKATRVVPP
jgi:hypothetical protein